MNVQRSRSSLPLRAVSIRDLDEGPFWYTLFGLWVRSDFSLPIARELSTRGSVPDLILRHAGGTASAPHPRGVLVAEERCSHGTVHMSIRHDPKQGAWYWRRNIGTCHIRPDLRHIDVHPEPGADSSSLALVLISQTIVYLLHLRGVPSLHASAVVTPRGAVAFLAAHGGGKSTMAACFLRRGAALLTDDVAALAARPDGIYVIPGPSIMKLWDNTVEHTLGLSEELPKVVPALDKRLLSLDGRYAAASAPETLRALYVLDRYDPVSTGHQDCSIRRLTGHEGLAALLRQMSPGMAMQPSDGSRVLTLLGRLAAQTPVRILRFPTGFEHHAAVHTRVMQDLE